MTAGDNSFIRPLLPLTKNQIEQYMKENKLEWREDSSNSQRKYKRNKVRLDLVPILQNLTGGRQALYKRLRDLSEQSEEIRELLHLEVRKEND